MTPDAVDNMSNPSSSAPKPSPPCPTPVSACALEMRRVKLVFLLCSPGEAEICDREIAYVEPKGRLLEDTFDETGFSASVDWSLKFPEGVAPPIVISGTHQVEFGVNSSVPYDTAKYYAETNSVVLLYPYLRQLISDLTVRGLGRSIMIRPLDVPKFIMKQQRERREERRRADLAAAAVVDTPGNVGVGPDAENPA